MYLLMYTSEIRNEGPEEVNYYGQVYYVGESCYLHFECRKCSVVIKHKCQRVNSCIQMTNKTYYCILTEISCQFPGTVVTVAC